MLTFLNLKRSNLKEQTGCVSQFYEEGRGIPMIEGNRKASIRRHRQGNRKTMAPPRPDGDRKGTPLLYYE